MQITTGQLRRLIREEIRKVSLKEATKKISPINPAKLQKVFLEAGVKSEAYQDKSSALNDVKVLTKLPDLVNKALDGNDSAYNKIMDGGNFNMPEYNSVEDKNMKKYFQKLSDLMSEVDSVMYDGELEMIPDRWGKLKAHIESFK